MAKFGVADLKNKKMIIRWVKSHLSTGTVFMLINSLKDLNRIRLTNKNSAVLNKKSYAGPKNKLSRSDSKKFNAKGNKNSVSMKRS